MPVAKKYLSFFRRMIMGITISALAPVATLAGGGMVLKNDACIIEIDFYSVHFTAYQPNTRGNQQFCQRLPDTGETLFVLDYLHPSLKEVPVSLRIIHNVTGQGNFVKLKHIEEIEDIDSHTVFYQPPVIRSDASLQVDFDLDLTGSYVGIVTAGHPSSDAIYTAVFPFDVGGLEMKFLLPVIGLFLIIAVVLLLRLARARKVSARPEAGP